MESWGETVDGCGLTAVTPRLHSFRIEANAEQQLAFEIQGDANGQWAIAKVVWYGNVQYVQEPGSG